ncbi:MAG: FKBP-type peptidyl-prolyl cis-trans isomerase N-terminal domain-containing protein, partial [Lacibacter sp.]
MRIITIAIAFVTISVSAFSQAKKTPVKKAPVKPAVAPKPFLRNGVDSLSYAIGMNIGTNMKAQGIEKLNYAALNKAIADAIKETTSPLMNQDQCNMTIQ